jgi:hypothetical protein
MNKYVLKQFCYSKKPSVLELEGAFYPMIIARGKLSLIKEVTRYFKLIKEIEEQIK